MNKLPLFRLLVKAGVLTEKEGPVPDKDAFGRDRMVVKSVFNLTEEGKKVYAADTVHQMGYGTIGGLCFGKVTVKEIAEFTEPSDAMGRRISHVSYTFVVTDFPAWAKSPEILAALPDLKKSVESENTPIKHQAMLVLTNNGWAPPR